MSRAIVKISGMTCEKCVERVEDSLYALRVQGEVSMSNGIAVVIYDPRKVTLDRIMERVKKSGYPVHEFQVALVEEKVWKS